MKLVLTCVNAVRLVALAIILLARSASAVDTRPATQTADGDPPARARTEVYKTVGETRLKLFIFTPADHQADRLRPAIIFFFGGGWSNGSPNQFVPQCERLAERGMVAVTADYRVYNRQRARVVDCVADAQSAVRWLRANARRLGIDPDRIAAGGGSAGGHLAAAAAMLRDFTTSEDSAVSCRPDALVLFNPALDLRSIRTRARNNPDAHRGVRDRLGAEPTDLSPAAHISAHLPPTLIFHGKADELIPYASIEGFVDRAKATGNRCELVGFEGQGHGFFNPGRGDGRAYKQTLRHTEDFLTSLGYLRGEDDAGKPAGKPDVITTTGARLDAVRTFADTVLAKGRDTYGPVHSPLFVDGLDVTTYRPAVWRLSAEDAQAWQMPREFVLSNLASQQNFFRVLAALTQITGDPRYKQAAEEAVRYGIKHLRHESGLFYWGGHAAWDAITDAPVGEGRPQGVAGKHEFKNHFPFYELMWELDPEATKKFIGAFWGNHILRWDILDMNRHGRWLSITSSPWENSYEGGPVPFIGEGLTFTNAGCDLAYAAAMLYHFTGDEKPLIWARRLIRRYAEARHPVTGLGADNYSEEKTRRFVQQFGPEFGERCTEATLTSLYGNRYGQMAVCRLKLYERLGAAGEDFKNWAVEDLTAYARHAYDPQTNQFWMTLIDGTRLGPEDVKRQGYVNPPQLQKKPVQSLHFWAYALAWKLTGDRLMWDMTRRVATAFDLGEWSTEPGRSGRLNLHTAAANHELIFGLLTLYEATKDRAYLALAERIGDNLLSRQFRGGLFVFNPQNRYAKIDAVTPLALLHLEVARRGLPVKLAPYSASSSFFHCSFEGKRTYDNQAIYEVAKEWRDAETRPAAVRTGG